MVPEKPDVHATQNWAPFRKVEMQPKSRKEIGQIAKALGVKVKAVKASFADIEANEEIYQNNLYQVNIRHKADLVDEAWPAMIHLSIKRLDKGPIHDWRDLQRIKNELVGQEHEAIELYPAESRLVDTANQYHLWVLAEPGMIFPFGWTDRLVTDNEAAGSKQRAFNGDDGALNQNPLLRT